MRMSTAPFPFYQPEKPRVRKSAAQSILGDEPIDMRLLRSGSRTTNSFPGRLLLVPAFLFCCFPLEIKAQQPFYTDDSDVTDRHKFHLQLSNEYDILQRSAYPSLRQNTTVFELDYGLFLQWDSAKISDKENKAEAEWRDSVRGKYDHWRNRHQTARPGICRRSVVGKAVHEKVGSGGGSYGRRCQQFVAHAWTVTVYGGRQLPGHQEDVV